MIEVRRDRSTSIGPTCSLALPLIDPTVDRCRQAPVGSSSFLDANSAFEVATVSPTWYIGERHNALELPSLSYGKQKDVKNDKCSVEVYENTWGRDKMSGDLPLQITDKSRLVAHLGH